MRTTVRLDDDLLREAKKVAASRGTTLTAVLDEALRSLLARTVEDGPTEPPPLPVFAGRGLQQGVDLHDSAALTELMEPPDGSS